MEEEIEAGKPIENAEINLENKGGTSGWGICGKRKRRAGLGYVLKSINLTKGLKVRVKEKKRYQQ